MQTMKKRVYIIIPSIIIPLAQKWHSDQNPLNRNEREVIWPIIFAKGIMTTLSFLLRGFDHYVIFESRGFWSREFWASLCGRWRLGHEICVKQRQYIIKYLLLACPAFLSVLSELFIENQYIKHLAHGLNQQTLDYKSISLPLAKVGQIGHEIASCI